MAKLADKIDDISTFRADPTKSNLALYLKFRDIERSLRKYIGQNGRTHRLIYVSRLVDDLTSFELSSDSELSRVARKFRTSATELTGWVQATNTTIIERLIVERCAPVAPDLYFGWERLFRLYSSKLQSPAISNDFTYLLYCHIHYVCNAVGAKDQENLDILLGQVRRPLNAVRFEALCAAECANDLLTLHNAAQRVELLLP